MLKKQADIRLIAEAANGRQLVDLALLHQPDVVITDIEMPELNGVEACRIINEQLPGTPVIALSSYDTDELIIDMFDAGAKGYLLKNADRDEIVKAVKSVHAGGMYYCERVSFQFQKMVAKTKHGGSSLVTPVEFSEREIEIITLSCRQYTNKEIAAQLNLSLRTIENHKDRMQHRIDAKNMVGVIIYALKHKLVNIDDQ